MILKSRVDGKTIYIGYFLNRMLLCQKRRFKKERIRVKEQYEKAVHERMSLAYYKQISDWCEKHGIALTGHPEKSTDIGYLQYFGIPCQDIVWRFVAPEDGKAICGEHSTMETQF